MTPKRRAPTTDLKGSRLVFFVQAMFLLVCLGLMRFI
jgi:hypothetical protein